MPRPAGQDATATQTVPDLADDSTMRAASRNWGPWQSRCRTRAPEFFKLYPARQEAELRLTLKIAAGVFLGIIAVLVTLNAPRWFSEWQKEVRRERARAIMENLTPDKLIARCGLPVGQDETAAGRRFLYLGARGTGQDVKDLRLSLLLTFDRQERFVSMHPALTLNDPGTWTSPMTDESEMVFDLPCLQEK